MNSLKGGSVATVAFFLLLGALFAAAGEDDLLSYGSRAGINVTITGRSGINTGKAELALQFTRENAKSYCVEDEQTDSQKCIDRVLSEVKVQPRISANCETGEFTNVWGRRFTFKGPAGDGDYPYNLEPQDGDTSEEHWSDYDVAIGNFKALCPARIAEADGTPNADGSEQPRGNMSSFRGIQLGMTEAQLAQSLDRTFVLQNELPAPKILGGRTDGGPNIIRAASGTLFIVRGEQQCGKVMFRDGQADRLDLYQCYFDIAGGMSIQDFAQQVIDAYGLEDGMAGSSQTRGDGAYQFEHIEYVGVKQATSERFTASSNGLMSNSPTLTIERIPKANFN
ncbi:hypothetical protein [Mesorhizobium sp. M1329]|uniref:hypothetical protein n=1 Tax=Mesorhizobium sp. M1329 TaxID=2957083 RepID=UPI0033377E98